MGLATQSRLTAKRRGPERSGKSPRTGPKTSGPRKASRKTRVLKIRKTRRTKIGGVRTRKARRLTNQKIGKRSDPKETRVPLLHPLLTMTSRRKLNF